MHRRKRIRRQLMYHSQIDGSGEVDHSKPVTPARRENGATNIETLTEKLQNFSIKTVNNEAKKRKKPKYIDTSKLLTFHRRYDA